MTTRVITVDLWGTIFHFRGEVSVSTRRRELVVHYAARCGVMDAELVNKAYVDATTLFYNKYEREAVTLSPRDRLLYQLNQIGIGDDGEEFEELLENVESAALQNPPPLAPNLRNGLGTLAERFKMAVVSDTGFTPGRVVREIFAKHGIDRYFADYSFSDENGCSKPNPAAFASVLDRLQVAHTDFLHIGDLERTDIVGAHTVGGRACLYVGLNDEWLSNTTADFVLHDWAGVRELIDLIEKGQGRPR